MEADDIEFNGQPTAAASAISQTPSDEGGGGAGGGGGGGRGGGQENNPEQDSLMKEACDVQPVWPGPNDEEAAVAEVVETDGSIRTETSQVRQSVECMELDDREEAMTDDTEEEEKPAPRPTANARLVRASPPSSTTSSSSCSSSSWPHQQWLSRKRRQADCDENELEAEAGAGATADVGNSPPTEEEEEEDQEMKKRRMILCGIREADRLRSSCQLMKERCSGDVADDEAEEEGRRRRRVEEEEEEEEEERSEARGDGTAAREEEEEEEEGEEEEDDDLDNHRDLFVSDSEDEESRNEWSRRRPALFLRTRSDSDRHGNNDRNAQEVVTRRMRSEYKPANNRCCLLVPATAPSTVLHDACSSSSSPSTSNGSHGRVEANHVESTWHRPPERCLLTLLRRREMGGRLGGRFGETGWSSDGGFTRQVRRSSHMLRRLRRRTVLGVHSGCVNALNFSPVDGNLIASGSDDQHIAVTDWMREKVLTKFDSGHEMNVFQTRFLYESQNLLIASCARDGMVRLSQLNSSGDLVLSKLLFHHNDSCNKVTVHPHEPHSLVSCGEDAVVVHMDIREPDNENRYFQAYDVKRAATVPLYSIHPHPHRSYEFVVCGRDPTIRIYDRRRISWGTTGARLSSSRSDLTQDYNEPLQTFCAFTELPGCQGREKKMWSAFEGTADAWKEEAMEAAEDRAEEMREREEKEMEEKEERDEDEDEDEDEDGETQLRRRKKDKSTSSMSAAAAAAAAASDCNASELASDATFLVNLHVTSAVYSNNGDAILCSYNDADIFLFDTKPGREERPVHKYCGHRNNTTVKCVNFYGPDSEYIVSGSDCGNIFFWSRASEQIANFQPGDNLGVVNVLEPHPSLPILATSGLDSDLKIWTPDWCDELEEVSAKRWPFEEKVLGRTVLENWMDRESAKTMLIGQSTLLRMLRIALQRTRDHQGALDAVEQLSDNEDDDHDNDDDSGPFGGGDDGGSGSGSDGEGRRRSRRRDFCVQS